MDRRTESRPTPDRRHNTAERDARRVWADGRRIGDLIAVFQAGQHVRCPGTKVLPATAGYGGGARIVCGNTVGAGAGWAVRQGSVVTVLAGTARWSPPRSGGQEGSCPNCRMRLIVLEDTLTQTAA